jgi:hypothetical protein
LTSNYCPLSPLVKIPPGTSNSFIWGNYPAYFMNVFGSTLVPEI